LIILELQQQIDTIQQLDVITNEIASAILLMSSRNGSTGQQRKSAPRPARSPTANTSSSATSLTSSRSATT
jgi:hypothetical protein